MDDIVICMTLIIHKERGPAVGKSNQDQNKEEARQESVPVGKVSPRFLWKRQYSLMCDNAQYGIADL